MNGHYARFHRVDEQGKPVAETWIYGTARPRFQDGAYRGQTQTLPNGENPGAGWVKRDSKVDGKTLWEYQGADPAMLQYELGMAELGVQSELAGAQIEASAAQSAIAAENQKLAKQQYRFWRRNYAPMEKEVIESARVGLDPSYYAARAGSDVTTAFDKAGAIQMRDMQRAGVDMASPRADAMSTQLAIARAAAEAGARTQARNLVSDVNRQQKLSVASIGRNMPGQVASISQGAAGVYGAAAGTLRGASQTYAQGYGAVQGALGNMQQANQFNAQMDFQNKQLRQQTQAQENMAIGNAVGSAIGTAGAVKMVKACIPEGTPIDGMAGPVHIEDVRVGDVVLGPYGTATTVMQKHEYLEQGTDDRFFEMTLEGGGVVRSCDMHVIDGRRMKEWSAGDAIAGRRIIEIRPVAGVRRSYDLLTSREDGAYRMSGVPVASMIPEVAALVAAIEGREIARI